MALFRFDNLCERFATIYTPIAHDPTVAGQRGKRFFRQDSANPQEMMEISKQLVQANKTDAFMSVVTAFDGELAYLSENASRPNFYEWRRHVLFWARTDGNAKTGPMEDLMQADAKAHSIEMASDFISFIEYMADPKRGNLNGFAKSIDWDTVELSTLPVTFNGWFIGVVNLTQFEPRQLCPTADKFDAGMLQQMFGVTF